MRLRNSEHALINDDALVWTWRHHKSIHAQYFLVVVVVLVFLACDASALSSDQPLDGEPEVTVLAFVELELDLGKCCLDTLVDLQTCCLDSHAMPCVQPGA